MARLWDQRRDTRGGDARAGGLAGHGELPDALAELVAVSGGLVAMLVLNLILQRSRAGRPIGFVYFDRIGIPVTLVSMTIATGYIAVRYLE